MLKLLIICIRGVVDQSRAFESRHYLSESRVKRHPQPGSHPDGTGGILDTAFINLAKMPTCKFEIGHPMTNHHPVKDKIKGLRSHHWNPKPAPFNKNQMASFSLSLLDV